MRLVYATAALAAVAASSPSLAQNFGGPRIEGRIGWDNARLGIDSDDGDQQLELDEDASTVSYGGEVGYDLSFGSAIIGAYAGIDFAKAEFCDELFGNDQACIEAERNITVGGRAGFTVTPQALLYAKGGYSNGRVRATYDNLGDLVGEIEESQSRKGYHFGVGAELAFGSSAYGKVEYVHTRYKDFELDEATGGSVRRNQLLAGIGFRF